MEEEEVDVMADPKQSLTLTLVHLIDSPGEDG